MRETGFNGFESELWDSAVCILYPDNEDPFDEGESKARNCPVASSCRGGQAERQEEPDPVEQECHWRERERPRRMRIRIDIRKINDKNTITVKAKNKTKE